MKRDEVINIICEFIGTAETNYGIQSNYFGYQLGLDLLDKLEELGMAPPEVAEPVKTSVMVATPMGWQEQVVEDSKVFVRKWEDE